MSAFSEHPPKIMCVGGTNPRQQTLLNKLRARNWEVDHFAHTQDATRALFLDHYDQLILDRTHPSPGSQSVLEDAQRYLPWLRILVIGSRETHSTESPSPAKENCRFYPSETTVDDLYDQICQPLAADRIPAPSDMGLENKTDQLELHLLRQLTQTVLHGGTIQDAIQNMIRGLDQLEQGDLIGVLVRKNDEGWVHFLHSRRSLSVNMLDEVKAQMTSRYEALSEETLKNSDIDYRLEGEKSLDQPGPGARYLLPVPIVTEKEFFGLMMLAGLEEFEPDPEEITFLHQAANHLATILLAMQNMHQLAYTDHLTGCFNRRYLEIELEGLCELSERKGNTFSMMLLDVDGFKEVNDTFGHQVGDECIIAVSELLRDCVRSTDTVIRLGGDEFLILFPQTTEEETRILVSRVLNTVRKHIFLPELYKLKLTLSCGVLIHTQTQTPTRTDILLTQVDQALYRSKRKGGNRYSFFKDGKNLEPPDLPAQSTPRTKLAEPRPEIPELNTPRILVVDDDPQIQKMLKQILELRDYEVDTAGTVSAAVGLMKRKGIKYDILLTDLTLSSESGFEILELAHQIDDDIIRIVLSGYVTADNALKALRMGVYEFVEKPVVPSSLYTLIHHALEYKRLRKENHSYQYYLENMVEKKSQEVEENLEEIKKAYEFSLEVMGSMLDARELETSSHSRRVMELTRVLLKSMDIRGQERKGIIHGALLHDIGKIAIPDSILLKPGNLTPSEWKVMRRHPVIGYSFIQSSAYLQTASEIILCHHESYDGSGYPAGLKGDEIPLGARIFSVIDAYDAMRSKRVYKDSVPSEEAQAELVRKAGIQFDPEVIRHFMDVIDEIEACGRWDEEEIDEISTAEDKVSPMS